MALRVALLTRRGILLVICIGKQFGPRAMYFEVREGGEIIDIE